MKKIITIALICSLSTQAHAGIWDSITGFFGGGDKTEEVQQATEAATTESTSDGSQTGNLVKTGLQLLPMLTQTLGVTNGQASGGMGAILQAAQGLLSQTEYGALLSAIPGAKGLIAAAPAIAAVKEGTGDMKGKLLNGAMEMAGKQGGALKQGADLVAQFKSLGLGADMIPKFGETANTFLTKSDKPEAGNLLTTALSSLGGLNL